MSVGRAGDEEEEDGETNPATANDRGSEDGEEPAVSHGSKKRPLAETSDEHESTGAQTNAAASREQIVAIPFETELGNHVEEERENGSSLIVDRSAPQKKRLSKAEKKKLEKSGVKLGSQPLVEKNVVSTSNTVAETPPPPPLTPSARDVTFVVHYEKIPFGTKASSYHVKLSVVS
eukprot:gene39376-48661_t